MWFALERLNHVRSMYQCLANIKMIYVMFLLLFRMCALGRETSLLLFSGDHLLAQLRKLRHSHAFVSAHGAALMHVLFLRPGTHAIEILPSDVPFFRLYRNLALLTHVRYQTFWSEPNELLRRNFHSQHSIGDRDVLEKDAPYLVDVDRMSATLSEVCVSLFPAAES